MVLTKPVVRTAKPAVNGVTSVSSSLLEFHGQSAAAYILSVSLPPSWSRKYTLKMTGAPRRSGFQCLRDRMNYTTFAAGPPTKNRTNFTFKNFI